MVRARRDFWGKYPNGKERWKKYVAAINAARQLYVKRIVDTPAAAAKYATPMIFIADGQELCELAFCSMLGIVTTQGYRMQAWKDALAYCRGGEFILL